MFDTQQLASGAMPGRKVDNHVQPLRDADRLDDWLVTQTSKTKPDRLKFKVYIPDISRFKTSIFC